MVGRVILSWPLLLLTTGVVASMTITSERRTTVPIGPTFPAEASLVALLANRPEAVGGGDFEAFRRAYPEATLRVPVESVASISAQLAGSDIYYRIELLPAEGPAQRVRVLASTKNHMEFTTYSVIGQRVVPETYRHLGIGHGIQVGLVSFVSSTVLWLAYVAWLAFSSPRGKASGVGA